MLHVKTSQFSWSLASDMAENHNSIESMLGTDTAQSAAPVLCGAAGAGRHEWKDAGSTGSPWQPGCWGHSAISLHPETLPGSSGCAEAARGSRETAVLERGAAHAGR